MTQIKSNIPKIRFKEFSLEWEERKVGDLINDDFIIGHLDGNHGELYPKSEEFTKEGIPYISANNLIDGKVDFIKCKFLPLERAEKFKKGISKSGDVLFAHNATVGPTSILETEIDYVILSTTVTYYRCNLLKLNNYYLKNYFISNKFIFQYSRVMGQTTRNQVPLTEQRKLKINLPQLPEQQKIAGFLSLVNEKTENIKEKKKCLEGYKKGVMQKIFKQEIRFKDENREEFGEWEEKKLCEVCSINKGTQLNKDDLIENGLYPALNGGINPSGYTNDSNKLENTITISEGGNSCGYVNLTKTKFWCGGHCYALEELKCDISYLFQILKFSEDSIMRLRVGSGLPNIQKKEINNFKVLLPSLPEQQKIADFLNGIDEKIEKVSDELEKIKEFKKGLLQWMFV